MKPNKPRTVGREELLAQRIEELRKSSAPPMSYETLATRMAAVGCPIQASGLQRIVKGAPRRRVTVDELVALAQVFNVTVDELISPPQQDLVLQAEAALRVFQQAHISWQTAHERLSASIVEEEMAAKVLARSRASLAGWGPRLRQLDVSVVGVQAHLYARVIANVIDTSLAEPEESQRRVAPAESESSES